MHFRVATTAALALGATFACALAFAALPPLPGDAQPAPESTIPPPGVDMPPQDAAATFDEARRGVVVLERSGKALGLGTVLGNDPRILTALSALGPSDACDVRYADGRTVRARVGHKDGPLDLALLVPLSGRYASGLPASAIEPIGADLRTFVPGPQGRTALAPARVKGKVDAVTSEGATLPATLELDGKAPALLGAPLVDAYGAVAGVTVRLCRPGDGATCAAAVVAHPLSVLRGFLARTPADAVPPSPWLGIQGAPDVLEARAPCPPKADCTSARSTVRGVRVLAVAPGSPAQLGGLRAGDLIDAIDGQPTDTPERLQELIGGHAVGDVVKAHALVGDKGRDVSILLRAAP